MKNILVIGGTGILGQPIVSCLLAEDKYEIYSIALDRASFSVAVKQYVVDRNSDEFEGIINDLIDKIGELEAVIDICAFKRENSETIHKLLKQHCNQFITFSTTLVYDRESRNEKAVTEITPLTKEGQYGGYVDGKIRLEKFWHDITDANWVLLRPYHILGEYSLLGCLPLHNRDRQLLEIIQSGEPIKLCEGGNIQLNVVHPEDIAKAVTLIIGNKKTFGQAYNLVNPEIITAKDYYLEIGRQLEKKVQIKSIPIKELWHKGLGWEMTTLPHIYSANKLNNDIDFIPSKPLSKAVSDALRHPMAEKDIAKKMAVHSRMNKPPSPKPPIWLFD